MKEQLIIRDFGPIRDIELELGRFNILIGEQATGKSTIAKMLAVCRYFSYIAPTFPWQDPFATGLEAWGLSELVVPGKTYVSYTGEHYSFEARSVANSEPYDTEHGVMIEIAYPTFKITLNPVSDAFKNLILELEKITPEYQSDAGLSWQIPTSFFRNEVAAVLDNPFYFPVERGLQSIFSLGRNSIANISDRLFNQFAELDETARSFKQETLIEPLNIHYKNENGQGFIRTDKHDFVRLANAASGYQSTIPVVLVLKSYNGTYNLNKTKKKVRTFIIEEPELNLFPDAQQQLVMHLVEQANQHRNHFLLTTHSPYVLTSLNNMLYAWQVGQTRREEVIKFVDEKQWINPADVRAYRLLKDGTCSNIIDEELQQIDVGEIDKVSRSINKVWDNIANTAFTPHEDTLAQLPV